MLKLDIAFKAASLGVSILSVVLVYCTNKEKNRILAECGFTPQQKEVLDMEIEKVVTAQKAEKKKKFLDKFKFWSKQKEEIK